MDSVCSGGLNFLTVCIINSLDNVFSILDNPVRSTIGQWSILSVDTSLHYQLCSSVRQFRLHPLLIALRATCPSFICASSATSSISIHAPAMPPPPPSSIHAPALSHPSSFTPLPYHPPTFMPLSPHPPPFTPLPPSHHSRPCHLPSSIYTPGASSSNPHPPSIHVPAVFSFSNIE